MSTQLEAADEILRGAYDLHVHTGPDVHLERCQTDYEYAMAARAAGMGGAVFKNHHTLTADRAAIVRSRVPGLEVFGGICLDASAGGLNPFAVESALRFLPDQPLCKIIWMPTIHAGDYGRDRHPAEPRYPVLDDRGHLLPAVVDVIDLVRDGNAALATGHLSIAEQRVLLVEAHRRGLDRIIVTHVDAPYLAFDLDTRREFAKYAYLEHAFIHSLPTNASVPIAQVIGSIRAVGVERSFISTDLGQAYNPPPVEGFRYFILALLNAGLPAADIVKVAHTVPRHLLGLA